MTKALTYGSYLSLDQLLSLQQPREDLEHDEMLFIVIHQVYELWFKQVLHEIDHVIALLGRRDAYRAQHSLKRVLTILKVLVAQLDILETMTPLEFQSFRARLEAASGFQSDQFRQLEFVLGNKSKPAIDRFQRYGSSVEDRRHAVRDLADVLEKLRPQAKEVITKKDEADLFQLANSFGIRHLNENQKTDYDPVVWLSWVFYYYLTTINACLHLLERKASKRRV